MMNFRKSVSKSKRSVAKSEKRTSCFHGLSWQQGKQYKSNRDKKFSERPSNAYVSTVKLSVQLKLPFRSLSGVQKHLGAGEG